MSKIENGNKVSVHYKGTLTDGSEFDNSRERGEALQFEVGSGDLIAGYQEIIKRFEIKVES